MPAHLDDSVAVPQGEVLIFATCHGWIIRMGLKQHAPDFSASWRVHFLESFETDIEAALDVAPRLDLLLVQYESAGDARTRLERIIERMRPDARIIRFAPIGYTPHWPYAFRDWNAPPPEEGKPWFGFGDRFILRQVRAGAPKQEIIDRYLSLDIARDMDLTRLHEVWRMDAEEKDRLCDVPIADLVADAAGSGRAFFNPYHCANHVLLRVTDRILTRLGKQPLVPSAYATPDALHDFELPIHPSVARHFGITDAGPDRLWLTAAGRISIAQYVGDYIDYLAAAETTKDIAGADSRINAGEFADAVTLLDRVERRTAPSVATLTRRALIHIRHGDYDSALAAARDAIALSPTHPPGYYWACHAAFYKADYLATLRFGYACLAQSLDPVPADIITWIADSHLRLGQPDIAAAVYRRALVQYPDHANALLGLGIALLRTGARAEARTMLDRLALTGPRRLTTLFEFEAGEEEFLSENTANWPVAAFLCGAKAAARGDYATARHLLSIAEDGCRVTALAELADICAGLRAGIT